MADFNNPKNQNPLLNLFGYVRDGFTSVAKMFDGTTDSNIPTGAKKIDGSTKDVSQWNGSSWDVIGSVAAPTDIAVSQMATSAVATSIGTPGVDTKLATEKAVRDAIGYTGTMLTYYVKSYSTGNGSGSDGSNMMSWEDFATVLNNNSVYKYINAIVDSVSSNNGITINCANKYIKITLNSATNNTGNADTTFKNCIIEFTGVTTRAIKFGGNLFLINSQILEADSNLTFGASGTWYMTSSRAFAGIGRANIDTLNLYMYNSDLHVSQLNVSIASNSIEQCSRLTYRTSIGTTPSPETGSSVTDLA